MLRVRKSLAFVVSAGVLLGLISTLNAAVITQPTDPIYGVAAAPGDTFSNFLGGGSNYPAGEAPAKAIDGIVLPYNQGNKYLNFSKTNVGFIVVPAMGPTKLTSVRMATANDAPDRDPMTITIEGTNDPFSTYLGVFSANWTMVYNGSAGIDALTTNDAAGRNVWGNMMPINGAGIFSYYRVLITTIRSAATTNSMQFSEIEMNGVPEPASMALLALLVPAFYRRRR